MALHPLRSAAPLTWRCTRSERVQCLRIGCTAHTNKPNREYAHLHMGRHCTTGRVRTLLRVCLCGCGPGRLSLLGLALCRRDQRRARPRCRWAAAGPGCGARGRWRGLAGLRDDAPSEARSADGERAGHRPRVHQAARPSKHNEAARPHRGPGGSCIRPLGGSQRLFQRICVPAAPRRWQASTTRAAMPASADLPHVRGSYCFLMPTSPSILRTPS